MTWDRIRFSVSSLVPADADCGSVLTQNSVDFPEAFDAVVLRDLRTLYEALRSAVVVVLLVVVVVMLSVALAVVVGTGSGCGAACCTVLAEIGARV